jgi:hypothetical protein
VPANVADAFQLGSVLAELRADMRHLRATGDSTFLIVQTTQNQVAEVKLTQGIQGQKIESQERRITSLEEAERPDYVTKEEHRRLEGRIDEARLTWPKLLAGGAALSAMIGVVITAATFVLREFLGV